eukprot:s6546_g2.t1
MHAYMTEFARRSPTVSFVDNLELLANSTWDLHQGILTLQTWSDLWKLELDAAKSYVWSTAVGLHPALSRLGWKIEITARDLGAQLHYGRQNRVALQLERFEALEPLWLRLRHSHLNHWQKQRLLRQCMWPKAFFGTSIFSLVDVRSGGRMTCHGQSGSAQVSFHHRHCSRCGVVNRHQSARAFDPPHLIRFFPSHFPSQEEPSDSSTDDNQLPVFSWK